MAIEFQNQSAQYESKFILPDMRDFGVQSEKCRSRNKRDEGLQQQHRVPM
jgi:hypothetical protein